MRLIPALALEPPHAYVAFVATHLEPLRAQAASVVGDEEDAEQLYPEVLTDVAARWRWLRWRGWLSRRGGAEGYPRRALPPRAPRRGGRAGGTAGGRGPPRGQGWAGRPGGGAPAPPAGAAPRGHPAPP